MAENKYQTRLSVDAVKERLFEAGRVLKHLPPERGLWPAGYRSMWPAMRRDFWIDYGSEEAKGELVRTLRWVATPAEVERAMEAQGWLYLIERVDRRRIVMARASGISWRRLSKTTGLSREWLRQHWDRGCDEIAGKLAERSRGRVAVRISRRLMSEAVT